jgi:hypothetical protein
MNFIDTHLVLNALNRAVLAIETGHAQKGAAEVLLMADYLPQVFRLQHLGDHASAEDVVQWLTPYATLVAHLAGARVQVDFSPAFRALPSGAFRIDALVEHAMSLLSRITPSAVTEARAARDARDAHAPHAPPVQAPGKPLLDFWLPSFGDPALGHDDKAAHLLFEPLN